MTVAHLKKSLVFVTALDCDRFFFCASAIHNKITQLSYCCLQTSASAAPLMLPSMASSDLAHATQSIFPLSRLVFYSLTRCTHAYFSTLSFSGVATAPSEFSPETGLCSEPRTSLPDDTSLSQHTAAHSHQSQGVMPANSHQLGVSRKDGSDLLGGLVNCIFNRYLWRPTNSHLQRSDNSTIIIELPDSST